MPWTPVAVRSRCNRVTQCYGVLFMVVFSYVQIIVFLVVTQLRNYPSVDDVTAASRFPSASLNSSDTCSPEIFRYYYTKRDYFPGEGRWVSSENDPVKFFTKWTRPDRFVPEICTFRYGGQRRPLPPETVRKCFHKKNITSIATMGDSNGAHHYDAIVNLLNQTENGNRCELTGREKIDHTLLMPDVAYYARYEASLMALLRASYRHCSSCVSRTHACQQNSSTTIRLEHLSMVSVLDSSLKIDVPHNHFAVNLQYRADTYQEFLLKYYLRGRYPDLLIIFPPFNHDKKSQTKASLSIRLRYFVDLLDLYLPPRTRVIWIPSFGEFESRKPPVWANRRMHGLLGTAKIEQFNQELYNIIKHKLLRQSERTMAFLDQVRVSATREDLSVDGVHMVADWYAEMMSYILQVLCSDVIADN